MGTVPIHRCSDCKHPSQVHEAGSWSGGPPPKVGPCSMGGCACRLTRAHVEETNPVTQVQTIPPVYSEATGKWLRR
jgi:hypothetical protein